MTTKRIDELPAISAVTGDDLFPVMDGAATTSKVTAANVRTYMAAVSDPAGTAAALVDDLSGVTNAATARTNLGLGTAATTDATAYATAAQGTTADAALPRAAAGAAVEDIGAVEWRVNTVAASGATETLDTSVYGVHDVTMDQSCTFAFSNPAPSGKETEFKLILRGAFTPTFPAAVDWASGSAPTYTTPAVYVFSTIDGGTTWFGFQAGKAFA